MTLDSSILLISGSKLFRKIYRNKDTVYKNVSGDLVSLLPFYCHIDKNTTLSDIFKLMIRHEKKLSEIFFFYHFNTYISEAKNLLDQEASSPQDNGTLVIRVVSDNIFKVEFPLEMCAVGDIVTHTNYRNENEIGKRPYESIHLSNLKDIFNYRILLKNDSIFRSTSYSDSCKRKFKKETDNCSIILFNLINTIIYELSWFGDQKEKNKFNKQLIKEIENLSKQKDMLKEEEKNQNVKLSVTTDSVELT